MAWDGRENHMDGQTGECTLKSPRSGLKVVKMAGEGVGGKTQSVYFSLGISMALLKPGSRQASAQAQLPWGYFWEACRLRLPPLPQFVAFPLLKSSSDFY